MTHLQALQISMKFLLQVASDNSSKKSVKFLEIKIFQFRNKKQKCTQDFLLSQCIVLVNAKNEKFL